MKGQLDTLGARLAEVEREIVGGAQSEQGMVAEVRAAEAGVESLRVRQLDAERGARSAAAGRLEEVRGRLVTWERDLAVAGERAAYAERRLAAIAEERAEARSRSERLAEEGETLGSETARLDAALAEARAALAEHRQRAEEVRRRLAKARETLEAIEGRERDIARRGAQLEGDALAADAQGAELGRRLERLGAELDEAALQLTDLESQGDLFADRLQQLTERVQVGGRRVDAAQEALERARGAAEEARNHELAAGDRASTLAAQRGALEAMERDREGVEPVVRAALARQEPGVLGVLVDFVRASDGLAAAVEAYLGPLARALVVRDLATAERIRRWFLREWGTGGGLLLLPLDRAPYGGGGTLLTAIEPVGEGAPWVRALLGDVDLVEEEALLEGEGPRLARSGAARDPRGVVRPRQSLGRLRRARAARAAADPDGRGRDGPRGRGGRAHRLRGRSLGGGRRRGCARAGARRAPRFGGRAAPCGRRGRGAGGPEGARGSLPRRAGAPDRGNARRAGARGGARGDGAGGPGSPLTRRR